MFTPCSIFATALLTLLCCALSAAEPLPALQVSANKRFLVRANGEPFFWLGDTAWELFHRLNREEAAQYLQRRAEQGYTVIQAVALAEFDGLNAPNAFGHTPLLENDPARPNVKDGPENDYWDHVDWVVQQANARGLYIGFLPTWGDKWNKKWGQGPEVFNAQNAETYGAWLGARYKNAALVWILGGDRPVENDTHRAIIAAFAKGLRAGGATQLITFHPSGGHGSAEYFHAEPWLDFNLRQNGHSGDWKAYSQTRADYDRTPLKPVLDGEPVYEDHPLAFKAKENGHSIAADVRRALYWNLCGGACGHTYGHHSVWQFFAPGRNPVNHPLLSWREALEQPGAQQMVHARRLFESRPVLTRIPDDSLIVPANPDSAIPGAGVKRMSATRDSAGSYAFIYTPAGRPFRVNAALLKGAELNAWWFNPRTGAATAAGTFNGGGELSFVPPDPGEALDWVLVLDDAARKFPPPGQSK